MLSIPTPFDLSPAIGWPVHVIGIFAVILAAIAKIRATGIAS